MKISLALITEANPRAISESHPSFLTRGKWRVLANGVKSKLSIRRQSPDRSVESIHALGETFDGECLIVIKIVESHIEDSRISVYAERVNV